MELKPGSVLGRYKTIKLLGEGGMGTVFLAKDTIIGRKVALKILKIPDSLLPEETEVLKKRFLIEAKAAGKILHPNIVTLFDIGIEKDIVYLAFEYIEGTTLEKLIRKQAPLDIKKAVKIAIQIANGLEAAHKEGIIHRDIKPSNILITKDEVVKISDFGIAKIDSLDIKLTITGSIVGTPQYLSPEQIKGEKPTPKSDLFALGLIIYELITGENPFEGSSITNVIYNVVNKQIPPITQKNPQTPPSLVRLIESLLNKNPDLRPSSAKEVAQILQNTEKELTISTTPTIQIPPVPKPDHYLKKKTSPVKLLGIVSILAFIGLITTLLLLTLNTKPKEYKYLSIQSTKLPPTESILTPPPKLLNNSDLSQEHEQATDKEPTLSSTKRKSKKEIAFSRPKKKIRKIKEKLKDLEKSIKKVLPPKKESTTTKYDPKTPITEEKERKPIKPITEVRYDHEIKGGTRLVFAGKPENAFINFKEIEEPRFNFIGRSNEWNPRKGGKIFELPYEGRFLIKISAENYKPKVYLVDAKGKELQIINYSLQPLRGDEKGIHQLSQYKASRGFKIIVKPNLAAKRGFLIIKGKAKPIEDKIYTLEPGKYRVAVISKGFLREDFLIEITKHADTKMAVVRLNLKRKTK